MSGAELLPSCKLLSPHGTAPPPPASVASPLASARLVGVVHRLAPTTGTGNGAGFMAYLPSCLYQEVESPGVTPGARPVPVPVPPPQPCLPGAAGLQGAAEFGPVAWRRPNTRQRSLQGHVFSGTCFVCGPLQEGWGLLPPAQSKILLKHKSCRSRVASSVSGS